MEDIRPVVEFLQAQGFDAARVCRTISSYPPVLACNVPGHLEPLMAALQDAGLKDPIQACARRPSLLGLKPGGSLTRIVGYLRNAGNTPEQIAELLENSV